MRVFVINLDLDADRWSAISAALGRFHELMIERVRAIYGPELPDAAVIALAGHHTAVQHRGTLGTFLSHVKAWEAVAKSGEAAVIMEDDAVLLGFERISGLVVPKDADLVFINDRMSLGSRHADPTRALECRPISDSLRSLIRTGFGVGGDGYILTNDGAKALLSAISKDGFYGLPDWRLLRYSLTPNDLQGEFLDTRVAYVVQNHHNPKVPPAWGILNAYCLNTPIVAFGVGGTSTRERANQ